MGLKEAINNIWSSDYVQKNPNKAYKQSYAAEYNAVALFLNGGAEPNWSGFSKLGKGLCETEVERRKAVVVVPPDPPPAGLSVDRATMLATGGSILREDCSTQSDPLTGLWGELAAQDPSRHVFKTSGGDPGPKANGIPQSNSNYRELSVHDGDSWQGESHERTELGRNTCTPYYTENAPGSTAGTFGIFDEGQHKLVFFSQRYHADMNMSLDTFQVICQLKQNQPYLANGPVDGLPALEIDIYGNLILLRSFGNDLWTTTMPAREKWIRYALDVTFSKDVSKGKVQLFVDHDGAGNFNDASKASPVITTQTLANCTSADSAKVANGARPAGSAIPSHMRIGCYHRNTFGPTTIDVDNVQIVG